MSRPRAVLIPAVIALALPCFAADAKRIVFAAGPKDHGASGRHEYEKDLAALKACLDHSNVRNISIQLYSGNVPNVSELKNAAVLVNGEQRRSHPHRASRAFPAGRHYRSPKL